jgi:putative transposase
VIGLIMAFGAGVLMSALSFELTECVFGPDAPRPWDDVDELELATLSWVHGFNEDRLHSHCDDVPPAEFESAFYAAQQTDPAGVGNQ